MTPEELTTQIEEMRKYGLRTVIAQENGYMIMWSNGSASWLIAYAYDQIKKGESMELDANEVLAYMSLETLESIIDTLPALPLYQNSFEANYR